MSDDFTTLTVADVARTLGLSRRKVYELVWAGELGHYRIGDGRGAIRFASRHVEDYLARCEVVGRAA